MPAPVNGINFVSAQSAGLTVFGGYWARGLLVGGTTCQASNRGGASSRRLWWEWDEESDMMQRVLSLSAALAVALFVGAAAANDKPADNTHTGLFVSVADGKLTMTDKDGKNQHSHTVAPDAKITCDGKDCKLEDLKKGFAITVTTKEGDATVAVRIDATSAPKDK
jgi:hypothetical protein